MATQFSATGPRGQNPLRGTKSPGTGFLYVAVIMFVAIAAGTLLSGGFIPVDPNGPGGPPTLEPYFGANGVDQQEINFPSATIDPHNNLQLKTFGVNICGSQSVFDFLIDTSGSMQDDNKIARLKSGLQAFVKTLSSSAVVGIQTFSSVIQERASLDYLKNNRAQVVANIDGLSAAGGTRMRDGFQLAKASMVDAVSKNKFPGYKYYLIVLSDGVPEAPGGPKDADCLTPPGRVKDPLWDSSPGAGDGERCFDQKLDPTKPTDLSADIKNIGAKIYTVGIFSQAAVSDTIMKPYLEDLLRRIASSPSLYFSTDVNAVNLTEILKELSTTFCQGYIGGAGSPTPQNYPFPTFPIKDINHPFDPPGGSFQ